MDASATLAHGSIGGSDDEIDDGVDGEPVARGPAPRKRKGKSTRWKIPPNALGMLEQVFLVDKFPTVETRKQLATNLKVTPRQVQVWFQNKRQRAVRPKSPETTGGMLHHPDEVRAAMGLAPTGPGGGGEGSVHGESSRGAVDPTLQQRDVFADENATMPVEGLVPPFPALNPHEMQNLAEMMMVANMQVQRMNPAMLSAASLWNIAAAAASGSLCGGCQQSATSGASGGACGGGGGGGGGQMTGAGGSTPGNAWGPMGAWAQLMGSSGSGAAQQAAAPDGRVHGGLQSGTPGTSASAGNVGAQGPAAAALAAAVVPAAAAAVIAIAAAASGLERRPRLADASPRAGRRRRRQPHRRPGRGRGAAGGGTTDLSQTILSAFAMQGPEQAAAASTWMASLGAGAASGVPASSVPNGSQPLLFPTGAPSFPSCPRSLSLPACPSAATRAPRR